jgi:hypothetical protein
MVTDNATAGGAELAMVPGDMPGNRADSCAFKATRRMRRCGSPAGPHCKGKAAGQQHEFHPLSPWWQMLFGSAQVNAAAGWRVHYKLPLDTGLAQADGLEVCG